MRVCVYIQKSKSLEPQALILKYYLLSRDRGDELAQLFMAKGNRDAFQVRHSEQISGVPVHWFECQA